MTTERIDPDMLAPERLMLDTWLEYHRATLVMKCDGLTDEQLRRRSVPPSSMSLLGLVRHMADVERNWFRRVMARETAPGIFWSDTNEDGDFNDVDGADVVSDFATWRAECDAARAIGARFELDDTGERRDAPVSFRWVLVHMIEEYARHNGHADLLRECVDSTVGD